MGDSVKGQLDFMLLAVLRDAPTYGYLIIEHIKRRSDGVFDLPESTVYPALHRLETKKLVRSAWAAVNGRRRRVYKLTDRGRAALDDERDAWRRFSSAVSSVGRDSS